MSDTVIFVDGTRAEIRWLGYMPDEVSFTNP